MDKNDVLKVSKNLYAAIPALLDGMPMGFAVMRVLIDEEGEPFDFVYEYANSLFAYLENMSLESLKQYSWGQLFPDEEMQVLGAYANIALNGGNRVIEEVEEGGDRKLRINCYQPAYGYCALIVEEVPNDNNDVSVQKMPEEEPVVTEYVQTTEPQVAEPFIAEPQQTAPLLDETELQEMQKLAQMVAPVSEPEAIAPLEAVSEPEVVVPIEPISELQQAVPVEPISELQQAATPIEVTAPESEKEAVAPIEPINEPQQAVPVEPVSELQQAAPATPIEVTTPESEKEAVTPIEPISEPQQAVPIEPVSELQQAAPAAPIEVTVPEAEKEEVAPIEPISEPQQAVPVEPVSELQQAAPATPIEVTAPEAEKEAVAPIEPISEPKQAVPVEPIEVTVPEAEKEAVAPIGPISEPQQAAPATLIEVTAPEAEKEAVAPIGPISEPQQAAPVEPVSEPQQAAPIEATAPVEEVITGGVTVSDIVEENKPEGYATIADLMASASLNKEEPPQENIGEGTPIGSIVGSYGGDSEGVWSEPESNEDAVEFTEVETFEVDASENAESFESQEDTATFVAVGEDGGFDMQPIEDVKEPTPEPEPSAAAEPIEAVPELKADENSFMAKIRKVVESIDQFNEDMALEILAGLLNDSSLDENVAGDVKKVKAMVECSMFAEAKELAQSLVAS